MIGKDIFKNKKVIVFDLDGTVVKLRANWHALKDVLTNRYAKKYAESCSFSSISNCLAKIVEKDDEDELRNIFKIIRQYELENITDTEIISEVVHFIKFKENFGISEAVKLAILSLNTRETIFESLKVAEISQKIDLIIGREDVRHWKPDPEGLMKIMQYFSVSPEDLVFFGDMEKDLKAGEAANVDSYHVDYLVQFVRDHKIGTIWEK